MGRVCCSGYPRAAWFGVAGYYDGNSRLDLIQRIFMQPQFLSTRTSSEHSTRDVGGIISVGAPLSSVTPHKNMIPIKNFPHPKGRGHLGNLFVGGICQQHLLLPSRTRGPLRTLLSQHTSLVLRRNFDFAKHAPSRASCICPPAPGQESDYIRTPRRGTFDSIPAPVLSRLLQPTRRRCLRLHNWARPFFQSVGAPGDRGRARLSLWELRLSRVGRRGRRRV